MLNEFILPDIGEGIVECELLEWLVAEGDTIEEDQPVAEVMTDKATVQIPAMHAGVVKKLHYAVGEIAKVHQPLFQMEIAGDTTNISAPKVESADNIEQPSTEKPVSVSKSSKRVEDFLLPDIGEGIVECEIVSWRVAEGENVAEDQPVVEVMTDKAVVEIPAKYAGVISKLYYNQGEIARVHEPLFALEVEGAESSESTSETSVQVTAPSQTAPSAKSESANYADGDYEPPVEISGRVLASPAVRRIARERNIDLTKVNATGKKGRVLKGDVLAFTSAPDKQPNKATTTEVAVRTAPTVGGTRVEKVKGIQAAMAKQMQASVSTIPHFTVSDELNMDNLIALRKCLKPEFEKQGVKLSFLPFFIKALSLALREFPIINAQLNDDATELTYFDDHNVGVAVDSKVGLLVPNIKQVQTKSLFDVAKDLQRLIDLGRDGKLTSDDLKAGTISISNIGALGGTIATPVINKPEAAIVALGKTQKLPRFDEQGNVMAASIMTVNWSGDHRIIDGATMVKFNNLWCSYLSNPETMLMHLA